MTAENPADAVTEQAARAITACIGPDRRWADCTPLLFARALHDAGLLADPVDRDANTRVAARNALEWRMVARKNEDRAERAEAEVAELRATVALVRVAAHEWSRSADLGYASIGDQFLSMLDGAGEQQ